MTSSTASASPDNSAGANAQNIGAPARPPEPADPCEQFAVFDAQLADAAIALRESQGLFQALSAASPLGVFHADAQGCLTFANAKLAALVGAPSPDVLLQRGWNEVIHPEDAPWLMHEVQAALSLGKEYEAEHRVVCLDGGVRHVRAHLVPVLNARGDLAHFVGTIADLTKGVRMTYQLEESERTLRLALGAGRMVPWELPLTAPSILNLRPHPMHTAPTLTSLGTIADDAAFLVPGDDGAAAQSATLPVDDRSGSERIVNEVTTLLQTLPDEDLRRLEAAFARTRETGREFDEEFRVRARDGSRRWIQAVGRVVRDDADARLVGVAVDVTVRKAMQADLTRQAQQDSLTGLANRNHFKSRVSETLLGWAKAPERPEDVTPAVVFIDLDGFKTINDSLGHEAGDRVLQLVAKRLARITREGDAIARLGGDEFAVLLGAVSSENEAAAIARRIVADLHEPLLLDGRQMRIGASVGVALAGDSHSCDDLLRNADIAMYRAKAAGKNTFQLYRKAMHAQIVERLSLQDDLQRALELGLEQFALHYQPIAEISGALTGFEALLRWNHPQRGPVSPATFIPLAEECGQINAIGRWVLVEACRQARAWNDLVHLLGREPITVTVNVSARQLEDSEFPCHVLEALEQSGAQPSWLCLEITESVLMQDTDLTLERLTALHRLGLHLAIDDFGTGFSSLAYLQRYPINVLKIDKAFIDKIAISSRDAALARMIVGLAQMLGLRTVAEGVEQAEQVNALAAIGCSHIQGYFISRPLEAQGASEFLLTAGQHLATPSLDNMAGDEHKTPSAVIKHEPR